MLIVSKIPSLSIVVERESKNETLVGRSGQQLERGLMEESSFQFLARLGSRHERINFRLDNFEKPGGVGGKDDIRMIN